MEIHDSTIIEEKYKKYRSLDPFPSIPCALLSSEDIHNYVDATGMIEPFYLEDLKSASYKVKIGGEVRYWEDGDEPKTFKLDGKRGNKKFTLKKNSIAFIEVEPKFRLPDYIAIRFNLKINNVYRGLLLGTGPLVDPGFNGKIYIPLHNMTSNKFEFEFDEALIWMEFTKTSHASPVQQNTSDLESKIGVFKPFPEGKLNMDLDEYLLQAVGEGKVYSSIPDAIFKAIETSKSARYYLKLIAGVGIGGFLAILVAFANLVYNSWSLQREYTEKVQKMEVALERVLSTNYIGTLNDQNERLLSVSEAAQQLEDKFVEQTEITLQQNALIDSQSNTIEEQEQRISLLEEEQILQ